MKRTLVTTWAVALALATAVYAAQQPARNDPDRFEPDIQKFEKADRQNRPADGGIVFTGSSSIRRWDTLAEDFAGLPVLNRGFGGSVYSDLVRYLDRVVLTYKPKVVVFYSGDDDLARERTPEEIAADCRTLAERVHQALPETRC